jgi:hypothetical protein
MINDWEINLAKYDEAYLNEDLDNRSYHCYNCKHHHSYFEPCTKRIDHENVRFAIPWFKSYCRNEGIACCDFEPKESMRWDYRYWTGFNDYFDRWFPLSTFYKKSHDNQLVWFTLHNQGHDPKKETHVRYGVYLMDYINNTMYDNDVLKAIKMCYYKRTKDSPTGYKLIHENISGVKLKWTK